MTITTAEYRAQAAKPKKRGNKFRAKRTLEMLLAKSLGK